MINVGNRDVGLANIEVIAVRIASAPKAGPGIVVGVLNGGD
jgi:hypothetical protein